MSLGSTGDSAWRIALLAAVLLIASGVIFAMIKKGTLRIRSRSAIVVALGLFLSISVGVSQTTFAVQDSCPQNVSGQDSAAVQPSTPPVIETPSIPVVAPPAAQPFLSRNGQALLLGTQPVKLTGFNLWRANITTNQPNTTRPINATGEMATSVATMTGNTMRTWFFQQFATTPTSSGYDWSAFDRTIAAAKANHKLIIATLIDQWSYDGTTFKDETWYSGGYKNSVLPLQRVTYRQYVADIVAHYKDEPTIATWELANEPEDFVDSTETTCSTNAGTIMSAWATDVSDLIKSIDQNHLVSLGGVGTGACGTNVNDYQTVMSAPSLDLCTFHDYYGASNPTAYEQWNGLNTRITQCGALNKPIIIEESGIDQADANRASEIDTRARAQLAMQGVAGYLVWQYDQDTAQSSDKYAVGPTDPVLPIIAALPQQ